MKPRHPMWFGLAGGLLAVGVLGFVLFWRTDESAIRPGTPDDEHASAELGAPDAGGAERHAAEGAPERAGAKAPEAAATVLALRASSEDGTPLTTAALVGRIVSPSTIAHGAATSDGAAHTLRIPLDATPHAGDEIVVDLVLRAPQHVRWSRRVSIPLSASLDLGEVRLRRGHSLDAIVLDVFGAPSAGTPVMVFPASAMTRYVGKTSIQPRLVSASDSVELRTDAHGVITTQDIAWREVAIIAEPVAGLWTPLAFAVDLTRDEGTRRTLAVPIDVRDRTLSGIVEPVGIEPNGPIEIECLPQDASATEGVTSDRRGLLRGSVAADRAFTIAPSPGTSFAVRAVCRDSSARSDWTRNVTLGTSGLTLVLRPVRTLVVEVSGDAGERAAVQCHILPAANFVGTNRPALLPRLASLSNSGSAPLECLEPEVAFGIRVSVGDGRVGLAGPFEVGTAPDVIRIDLPSDATRIEGTVVVAPGANAGGIPVQLHYRATNPLNVAGFAVTASMAHSRTITRSDGSFTLYPPLHALLVVTTSTSEHGFGSVEVGALEQSASVRIRLEPRSDRGAAAGSLLVDAARPARMVAATNGLGLFRTTWVDSAGRFQFERLPAGEWQFAEVENAPWQGLLGADDAVDCNTGSAPTRALVVAGRCVELGVVQPTK